MGIFAVLGLIVLAVNSLRVHSWNVTCRTNAYLNNKKTYQGYGPRRTVSTNKTVHSEYNPVTRQMELVHGYGHYKEIIDTKRPLLREAQSIANKRYAIENGYPMYEYDWELKQKINDNCAIMGRIYADTNTDEKYVIRTIGGKFYYVNITTGLILRETETSKIKRKLYPGWKGEKYDFKLNQSTRDQRFHANPSQYSSNEMDFYNDCKTAPHEYYEEEVKKLKEGSRW